MPTRVQFLIPTLRRPGEYWIRRYCKSNSVIFKLWNMNNLFFLFRLLITAFSSGYRS